MKVIFIVSENAREEKEQNCDVIQPMPTAQCLQWQIMREMEMKMTKRQIQNQMMSSSQKANHTVFTVENNERNENSSNDQKANSTTNDAIHPRSTAQYSQ